VSVRRILLAYSHLLFYEVSFSRSSQWQGPRVMFLFEQDTRYGTTGSSFVSR